MDHDGKGCTVKAVGLWFRFQAPNLVVVWPYAKCFISLHLNFLPGGKGKMSPFWIAIGYREVECLEYGLGSSRHRRVLHISTYFKNRIRCFICVESPHGDFKLYTVMHTLYDFSIVQCS